MFDNGNPLSPDRIREINAVNRLLKPKFKQMIDYPFADSGHKMGIIHYPPNIQKIQHYRSFPNVFREMEWWEEMAELPGFLKPIDKTLKEVFKVKKFRNHNEQQNMLVYIEGSDFAHTSRSFLPATEREWDIYQKSLPNVQVDNIPETA